MHRSLCVIASSYNVQIVHKAQKSLAKWEINNVNRNALRWAATLECPTLTVVIPPFLFPKCFFKNMCTISAIFREWLLMIVCQDLIKHLSVSQQLRVFVLQTWTSSLCCVLPHLFQTNDKDSPYLWTTPAQHIQTQTQTNTLMLLLLERSIRLFLDASVLTHGYFTPKMKVLSSFTHRLMSKLRVVQIFELCKSNMICVPSLLKSYDVFFVRNEVQI